MRRRFRLNVQLVVETLVLLLLTLGVLTYYSHKVLSEEAHRDANLMLDATVQGHSSPAISPIPICLWPMFTVARL